MGIEFFKSQSNLILVRPRNYSFPIGLTQTVSSVSADYIIVAGGGGGSTVRVRGAGPGEDAEAPSGLDRGQGVRSRREPDRPLICPGGP